MHETTLKTTAGGLIHDIGKLADRNVMEVSNQFILNHADLYQPFFQGRHTHSHAVYTAAFIEQMKDVLPQELNALQWGAGDSFVNLAAGHHRPETPLQWIVAMADRLSSGWDRNAFSEYNQQVSPKNYRKTRLKPLFERLTLESSGGSGAAHSLYCYPLAELSAESIFPKRREDVVPQNGSDATAEYRSLLNRFTDGLAHLLHRHENIELWLEHFDSLMLACTSAIPAQRAGDVNPDVSLYDHSRSTAALAAALFLYHRCTDTLSREHICASDQQKLFLIGGDFYGIQDFIFSSQGDVRKQRSKLLRGRSLQISLFSELAADMICRRIGLPFCSALLSAAGKFTIIAPNTEEARHAVQKVDEEINDWLMRISFGENALGIVTVEASPDDFVRGRFLSLWERLQRELQRRKYSRIDLIRHAGARAGYLESFDSGLTRGLCPLCGKRPCHPDVESTPYVGVITSACKICRDQLFLGSNTVKKGRLAVIEASSGRLGSENRLFEPIFNCYQLMFCDDSETLDQQARSGQLLRYWDLTVNVDGTVPSGIATRFINGYVPLLREEDRYDECIIRVRAREFENASGFEAGELKTFGEMAARSLNPGETEGELRGVEALGILKADVDNLGILMSCGLPPELFTLSRLATLSRQLNFFFSVYLPHLLQTDPRFADVYTVFAGGDDLFLIGPWNRVCELATHLHEQFSDYTCRNPEITFSAGIHFAKPHVPVDRIGSAAEQALKSSKDAGKDRMTLFGLTVTWEQLEQLATVAETLGQWLEKKWINKAMLYRLNRLIDQREMEATVMEVNGIHLSDMDCTKWRATLAYTVGRNVAKEKRGDERREVIEHIHASLADWLTRFGASLRIPLWRLLYEMR